MRCRVYAKHRCPHQLPGKLNVQVCGTDSDFRLEVGLRACPYIARSNERGKITKLKISTRMEGRLRLNLVGLRLLGTALFENVQIAPSGRFSLPRLDINFALGGGSRDLYPKELAYSGENMSDSREEQHRIT